MPNPYRLSISGRNPCLLSGQKLIENAIDSVKKPGLLWLRMNDSEPFYSAVTWKQPALVGVQASAGNF